MKDIARFLKVFADESRLQILWALLNHEELCVCDISEALGVSQSKVSRHLATLRHTGLVSDRKDGAWSFYSLCPANNEFERAVLDALRKKLGDHPDAVHVLQNLHDWAESRQRDVSCVLDGPCCSLKQRRNSVNHRCKSRAGDGE